MKKYAEVTMCMYVGMPVELPELAEDATDAQIDEQWELAYEQVYNLIDKVFPDSTIDDLEIQDIHDE